MLARLAADLRLLEKKKEEEVPDKTTGISKFLTALQEDEKLNSTNGKKESEQQRITREILATLDALGGQNVGEDSLAFQGTRFVLPEGMQGDIPGAIKYLRDWDEQQNTTFAFNTKFNYRPYDGAAAFERAMKRVFGSTGIGRATVSFFGSEPPEYETIPVGPHGETAQVPWGRVEFSPISAEFYLGAARDHDFGIVFALSVEAPRRHRRRVEGFFKVVEDELRNGSIYKGKAITNDPQMPGFIETDTVDENKIIYHPDVLTQLDVNLWAPLRYTDELRKTGVPLKRAVLLEGPNGTGKTLAGLRTAQIAQENGWTFILVRAGEDPLEALKTARVYAPAVVWAEDLEVIAAANGTTSDRRKISKVLDTLDGLQGKGSEVMAGFTTNFVAKLDKAVIRPGRLDAVIHVAELDSTGYERLIRALVPSELMAADVDYRAVTAAYEGFLPAFAAEAAQRAVRYSIARNHGHPASITTADLVDAAKGMRDHLHIMDKAQHTGSDTVTLTDKLVETVQDAVFGVKGNNDAIGPMTFVENENVAS